MPEKPTNEIARPLRDLFEKGNQAVARENLDYALDIYLDVLNKDPAFFECREALRKAQIKKSGQKKGFLSGLKGPNAGLAKAKMVVRKNPKDAMSLCEKALNSDVNNTSAHRCLAEAAIAEDLPGTAVMSLEIAHKLKPKDRDIAVELAQAYVGNHQGEKAESVMNEQLRRTPNDPEIQKLHRDLSANRTMGEGGYDKLADGSGSFRDVLKDQDGATKLEQEARGHKDKETLAKLLDDAYGEMSADPSIQNARKVADLYFETKDYASAIKYYKMILAEPGAADPTLEKIVSQCQAKLFDLELEELDSESEDYLARVEDIEKRKAEFRLKDAQKRVERYPNELALHYELGTLFFKTDKITEAIKAFQKSQKDAKNRIRSLYYLGQCFAKRKMYDMAAKQLETAIEEKNVQDEENKELIYTYGCILEEMDKREQAIEQFKKIYEMDIGYKDVSDKVDAYYGG
jgi:tetratricopeptide (TPR) repeat protein